MGLRGTIAALVVVASVCGTATADSHHHHHKPPAPKPADPAPAPATPPAPDPAPAPAPPPPPQDEQSTEDTPWGKGVSQERKEAALKLLNDGNALFLQNHFPEALATYQKALEQWNHPAIHFNIVRVLLALDRPLEAEESLEKALAYGAAPLETEHYAEALTYKPLLAGRIGTVEISCSQRGVQVKLDGSAVIACPGKVEKKMLPGNHVVIGTKGGFQTATKDLVVMGGNALAVDIQLVTIAQATVYRARWATWKPWAIAGSGVAVGGVGLVLELLARSSKSDLDRTFQSMCQPDCTKERYAQLGLADKETSVERNSRIAVGTMIGGGVIIAAGVVALALNRPKPYLKEQRSAVSAQLGPTLVPTIGPGGGGLAFAAHF